MTVFDVEDVIYHKPATIVLWKDGTKTVVKCHKDDEYSKERGLAYCLIKKMFNNSEYWYEYYQSLLNKPEASKKKKAKPMSEGINIDTDNGSIHIHVSENGVDVTEALLSALFDGIFDL